MAKLTEAIRAAIKASDQTPYAIAKGAGVARSQLSRLLSGETGMSVDTIEQIAEFLGLSIQLQEREQLSGNDKPGYRLLKNYVTKQMGGKMTSKGVGTGRVWTIELWGRTAKFSVSDRKVNELDEMYEPPPGNPTPQTWDDWPKGDSALRTDVRWRVIELICKRQVKPKGQ